MADCVKTTFGCSVHQAVELLIMDLVNDSLAVNSSCEGGPRSEDFGKLSRPLQRAWGRDQTMACRSIRLCSDRE